MFMKERINMIVCKVILLMKICLQERKLIINFILAKECQKNMQNLSFIQVLEMKYKI